MQTNDGEKSSTIPFLLAILLKDGLKRIFKTCNEKIKDLQVKFDDFTPNETLKNNIVEAGKLLDIKINFVWLLFLLLLNFFLKLQKCVSLLSWFFK